MHEMSLAQAVIDETVRLAREHGADRVLMVKVAMGPFPVLSRIHLRLVLRL
ncbi:MAG: hypothetical protein ACUVQ6_01835 [Dissulfurimicrobium sp.]|uniref:hypothetical protein n=1 Tax=Dissulfurimicrobium sp. TaxID=2022436 RepID=UPI004048F035